MRIKVVIYADVQPCLCCLRHVILERGVLGRRARVAHGASRRAQHRKSHAGSLDLSPVNSALRIGNVDALYSLVGYVLLAAVAIGYRRGRVPVTVIYQPAALGNRELRSLGLVIAHRALKHENTAVYEVSRQREVTCLGSTAIYRHRKVTTADKTSRFRGLKIARDLDF